MYIIGRLPDRNRENLERLAEMRGQTVEEAAEAVADNILRSIPRSVRGYNVPSADFDVEASGLEDGLPWVRLGSGRTFYDHPAVGKDAIMWVLLRDLLPRRLTADTYVVALHAVKRYLRGASAMPENAKVAVDAGAYVGYKAISFLDAMGPGGRVIAIEMMPDNFSIMQRNIEANSLGGSIAPVWCALSDQTGTVEAQRKRKQQATIADVDELDFADRVEVPMETLSNILDRSGVDAVDLLNIQVNGAELATLHGLGHWFERVSNFRVYAMYSNNGVPTVRPVREFLEERGARVISDERGVVVAQT